MQAHLTKLPISLLLATLLAFTNAHAGVCGDFVRPLRQTSAERHALIELYNSYSYYSLPFNMGFEVIPNGDDGVRDFRLVLDLHSVEKSIEHWTVGDSTYLFANVGFRNLRRLGERMNRVVLSHLTKNPMYRLRVRHSVHDTTDLDHLVRIRWDIHDQVLQKYRETKEYLSDADLKALRAHPLLSDNSDVIYLLKNPPPPQDPARGYTVRDLTSHPALTIQISYYGDRDFLKPTLEGVLEAAGFPTEQDGDKYPFEYRLSADAAEEFRAALDERFQSASTAELVRYVKFGDVPRNVQELFILRTMQLVQKRKMKTVLAAGDPLTTRLFRGFGFSVFAPLPTDTDVHEWLSFIETESEKFGALHERLSSGTRDIKVESRDGF